MGGQECEYYAKKEERERENGVEAEEREEKERGGKGREKKGREEKGGREEMLLFLPSYPAGPLEAMQNREVELSSRKHQIKNEKNTNPAADGFKKLHSPT